MEFSLDEVMQRLNEHQVIDAETPRPPGMGFDDLCYAVALRVAQDFDHGVMSYSDGDGIMNTLWASITSRLTEDNPTTPALDFAIAVFDAFDAGEYDQRDGDDRPPWQRFTVPLIRSLLTSLNKDTLGSA